MPGAGCPVRDSVVPHIAATAVDAARPFPLNPVRFHPATGFARPVHHLGGCLGPRHRVYSLAGGLQASQLDRFYEAMMDVVVMQLRHEAGLA